MKKIERWWRGRCSHGGEDLAEAVANYLPLGGGTAKKRENGKRTSSLTDTAERERRMEMKKKGKKTDRNFIRGNRLWKNVRLIQ
ncbi:hypothetical protein AVEN_223796-1 [Araneus ventricosus]|uniref:Uncharacterized protein n=1 Tax=Araneus ventricosus TaxID=182803 RepID=A0A4Y2DM24_ARAVE|nr:hypothetical protein AVEN_223796-1 [Araneus ventricosus]